MTMQLIERPPADRRAADQGPEPVANPRPPDAGLLPAVVAACARRKAWVLLLAALLGLASLGATLRHLGVNTDTGALFAAGLPWKQRAAEMSRLFPQNDKLIVAVVDAAVPEQAEATAAALADAVGRDTRHFSDVRRPDALPYLQDNAFLLIGLQDLQDVLQRVTDAQPFLGPLAADPSLRGLCTALGLVVEGVRSGQDTGGLAEAMGKFHASLDRAAAGHPLPLSWQTLLGGRLAGQAGRYRFVLAKPVLDYHALQPGGAAAAALRATAAGLPTVQAGQARVRLTGQVVMDDEEFATVAEGAVAGLVGSLLLVVLWLYLAVQSWRLMLPILATLGLGLLLTTGFAALAIGTLNLVSVAFAVLFVGIAVDFAIQFAVRFRERRFATPGLEAALRDTARRSLVQILVAALATAAGFLAFAPTEFVGVAQLGIIAGVGMLIAFACTLTFLPAMLALCRPRPEAEEVGFSALRPLDPAVRRFRWPVLALFGALSAAGAVAALGIEFDGDPLHTKDQRTEAIRTLRDLMQDPVANPYTIQVLAPSQAAAQAAAQKLASVRGTGRVLTLLSFVPTHQAEKLALIEDAAQILNATLAPSPPRPIDEASLRQATRRLAASLDGIAGRLRPDDPLLAIDADLHRLAVAPGPVLLAANAALTRFLPDQLARLRRGLAARPVTAADIPATLRAEWSLPDGRARVQALPAPSVQGAAALRAWVTAARRLVPQATGAAPGIVASADTITGAFGSAAMLALCAIALILALTLRRALEVALVMTPLLVSGLLTALVLRLSGLDLNFANIIALPLLLGVGVSFNIYFVMNWRAGSTRFIGTATARAVIFSALTTSTAFGSLALSAHPGTASMGVLLLISLACTVVTTLLFLPALLCVVPAPQPAPKLPAHLNTA
jgi:hopanoid biosynthesis associated RND transporter like protein HpnN